jgi:bacillithiol biosynthesis cysteine-adding enzyme BshC
MGCQTIPFRRLPHQPKLFLHYLHEFPRVKGFYAHPPTLQAVTRVAKKMAFPAERRKNVVAILREQNAKWGASTAALNNLERLEKGAAAIVTGQQVGLFGGPAYAVYKALTAVQVAAELTRAGVNAVPVFWLATEDHDVDEVRHTTWFQDGKLHRFELPAGREAGRPVGSIPLGPQIDGLVREATALLQGPESAVLADMLRESYRAEETYGSAFGKLFARLFANRGLILLDPLDEGLHRIAAPVYRQALEDRDVLNERLLERGTELDKAGFAAQVKVTSRSTLLFRMHDGVRQVVSANGTEFHSGGTSWPRAELARISAANPEQFSPNALLRSVVQDYLLPTAAYLAGSSEIAYFAQSEVVYRHMMERRLLGRIPVILPRADFTLMDLKAERLLKRYALTVEAIWGGSQKVRERMECTSVPKTLGREFDRNVQQLERTLGVLDKKIAKLDPTLRGAVETARKKMSYQLEKLRRKTGKALDQKSGQIRAQEEFLNAQLYPHKVLQSRELCLLPFLARWGMQGLDELQKCCGSNKLGQHYILTLR